MSVSAQEEGAKKVRQARLFALGAFVVLMALAIYAAVNGDTFNAFYFGGVSLISLGLYFYVRKTLRANEPD